MLCTGRATVTGHGSQSRNKLVPRARSNANKNNNKVKQVCLLGDPQHGAKQARGASHGHQEGNTTFFANHPWVTQSTSNEKTFARDCVFAERFLCLRSFSTGCKFIVPLPWVTIPCRASNTPKQQVASAEATCCWSEGRPCFASTCCYCWSNLLLVTVMLRTVTQRMHVLRINKRID